MAVSAGIRQRAEQLAALLPPLLVEAERIAVTVAQGVHGRRRVGTGDAFWQFRRYQPGDPAQTIDWRQSAKRQSYFIRQNEWEAAESVWLWRDDSPSMAWRSSFGPCEKLERATLLLLATAALLVRGGERIALLGENRLPSSGRSALERMAQALLLRPAGAPHGSLPPKAELPRYARMVLISDFLSPLDQVAEAVRGFAGEGVNGVLLQVLDPAEQDLPFAGRTRFEGMEGEAPITVSRVESLADDWRRKLMLRHERLADLARRNGWHFAVHRTDRPAQAALLSLYTALSGQRVMPPR
jgi:uncharacterized protein (DUF58 family)